MFQMNVVPSPLKVKQFLHCLTVKMKAPLAFFRNIRNHSHINTVSHPTGLTSQQHQLSQQWKGYLQWRLHIFRTCLLQFQILWRCWLSSLMLQSAWRGCCQAHPGMATQHYTFSKNIYSSVEYVNSCSHCIWFWNGCNTLCSAGIVPPLLPACIFTAAPTSASSLVTPIFQWSVTQTQSMLALVKLITLQISLHSGRNYWLLYFINNLLIEKCWKSKVQNSARSPPPSHNTPFHVRQPVFFQLHRKERYMDWYEAKAKFTTISQCEP